MKYLGSISDDKDLVNKKYVDDLIDDIHTELDQKANNDGAYENMTVGNAEQLVSTIMVENQTPYIFRPTGGSADVGNRSYPTLVGGTLAWNQLSTVPSTQTVNHVTFTNNGDGSVTVNGTATAQTRVTVTSAVLGAPDHIIYMKGSPSGGSTNTYCMVDNYQTANQYEIGNGRIYKTTAWQIQEHIQISNGYTANNLKFIPQAVDLTLMFGSAVANYIYSLETANAGAGVAWFRKLFPASYYPYNAGELLSVNASEHITVGFNAFDNSAGTAQLVGGQQYQITGAYTALAYQDVNGNAETITPDSNGLFTPTNNGTLTVTGGDGTTTCVHLVWSGYRNGEYEPYTEHTYPLDDTLTLRGIPKLDADNNLYYDGDIYKADGTVTRRYGIVDLGTKSWGAATDANTFYADIPDIAPYPMLFNMICPKYTVVGRTVLAGNDKAIAKGNNNQVANKRVFVHDSAYSDAAAFKVAMSGVYLVYELATPTIESADPFQSPQIVDDFGTEQYIVTAQSGVEVPVGHVTQYPANLRDKLQHLPDLASTDGLYGVQQTGSSMALVPLPAAVSDLPDPPTTDGTYTLTCTVSDGVATYSWE